MANAFKARILLQLMEIYHAELTKHLYSLPNEKPDNFEDLNRETYLLATVYDNFLNTRDYTLLTHLSSFSHARFTYLLRRQSLLNSKDETKNFALMNY